MDKREAMRAGGEAFRAKIEPRDPARCDRCGRESRYSGTVAWCPCSGWLESLPGVTLRVEREPDALASCEEYAVVAEYHAVPRRAVWGFSGPVGTLGRFLGYVAGEYRAEGYAVTIAR